MATLELTINNREYKVSCNEGEEAYLLELAEDLDKRLQKMARGMGTANNSLMLMMVGLSLLDELRDATKNQPKNVIKPSANVNNYGDKNENSFGNLADKMMGNISGKLGPDSKKKKVES